MQAGCRETCFAPSALTLVPRACCSDGVVVASRRHSKRGCHSFASDSGHLPRVSRLGQARSRTVTTSSLPTRFNQVIQCDLLFIDVCTRHTSQQEYGHTVRGCAEVVV